MSSIRFRLFLMMVLEFFIWGAWFPLVFGYLPSLGFQPWEQGLILNAFPLPNRPALDGEPNSGGFVGSTSNPASLDATRWISDCPATT